MLYWYSKVTIIWEKEKMLKDYYCETEGVSIVKHQSIIDIIIIFICKCIMYIMSMLVTWNINFLSHYQLLMSWNLNELYTKKRNPSLMNCDFWDFINWFW